MELMVDLVVSKEESRYDAFGVGHSPPQYLQFGIALASKLKGLKKLYSCYWRCVAAESFLKT